jgi:hypothetical protein
MAGVAINLIGAEFSKPDRSIVGVEVQTIPGGSHA